MPKVTSLTSRHKQPLVWCCCSPLALELQDIRFPIRSLNPASTLRSATACQLSRDPSEPTSPIDAFAHGGIWSDVNQASSREHYSEWNQSELRSGQLRTTHKKSRRTTLLGHDLNMCSFTSPTCKSLILQSSLSLFRMLRCSGQSLTFNPPLSLRAEPSRREQVSRSLAVYIGRILLEAIISLNAVWPRWRHRYPVTRSSSTK